MLRRFLHNSVLGQIQGLVENFIFIKIQGLFSRLCKPWIKMPVISYIVVGVAIQVLKISQLITCTASSQKNVTTFN